MDRINVKILGYYGKGNIGDDLIYESLKNILKELKVRYSKTTEEGMFKFKYINSLFEVDHQISIGGLLQNISSNRSFHYYITMMNFARSNILFGQSLGPFINEKRCYRFMKNIKGLNGVLLRDWKSYRTANELWADENIDIHYGTDIVFNMDLSKYINEIEYEKYALVVIKKNENRNRVYELIRFIRKYMNKNVLITIFDLKDTEEFKRIKHDFYDENMVFFKATKSIKDAISLVYHSDYVFSWRLHPLILAVIFEKPFMNPSENQKIINFFSPYLKMPFVEKYENGFEYMFEKLDVSKIKKEHLKLAKENIKFIIRTLNNNIFQKKIDHKSVYKEDLQKPT